MARTKASVGAKISSGKSSKARCAVAPSTSTGVSSGGGEKSSRGSGGGNPVCPRETPKWQRPITNFFINKHNDSRESDGDGEVASSSKPKPKRNIIESDDESSPEKPKNNALDETIELEELTGEDSHKIEEYYPKGTKGKGVGKKTKETNGTKTNEVKETDEVTENGANTTKENGENDTKEDMLIGNTSKNINNIEVSKDKENINTNIDREEKIQSGKDSGISGRNKREREDRIEEENLSKKIKIK